MADDWTSGFSLKQALAEGSAAAAGLPLSVRRLAQQNRVLEATRDGREPNPEDVCSHGRMTLWGCVLCDKDTKIRELEAEVAELQAELARIRAT